MDKLLFLDVDGVLNNLKVLGEGGNFALGCRQLSLLKLITSNTCCEIVLSSTWRLYEDHKNALRDAFESHLVPLWIGETPDFGTRVRRDEILSWLIGYEEPAKVVILDDDKDAMLINAPERFRDQLFVHTDFDHGLTLDHAEAILEFFKEDCR
jgi:hypothetical protein